MKKYFVIIFLLSCSSTEKAKQEQDPLQYTKKHWGEHVSLYKNGAFQVPMTTVKLIPPGPDTFEFFTMAVGIKARDSFLLALENAASSVNIVKTGTVKSMKLAGGIYKTTTEITGNIATKTWNDSIYIISKALALPKDTTVYAYELSKDVRKELHALAKRLDNIAQKQGEEAKQRFLQNSYLYADSINYQSNLFAHKTRKEGKAFHHDSSLTGKKIDNMLSTNAQSAAKSMIENTKEVSRGSVESAYKLDKEMSNRGSNVDDAFSQAGTEVRKGAVKTGHAIEDFFNSGANISIVETERMSKLHRAWAKKQFIQGYLTLPSRVAERAVDSKDRTLAGAGQLFEGVNDVREEGSNLTSVLFWKTIKEYGKNAKESLENAGKGITGNNSDIGITLGMLKAILWTSKALFWDSIIAPVTKLTAASLGYITINSVAYPTMLIGVGGVSTAQIAVEASWNASAMAYDLIAPSFLAGVASVFSIMEISGGRIAATGLKAVAKANSMTVQSVGLVGDAALTTTGKVANVIINASGKAAATGVAVGGQAVAGAMVVAAPAVYSGGMVTGKLARAGGEVIGATGEIASEVSASSVRAASQTAGAIATTGGWISGQLINVSYKTVGKIERTAIDLVGVPLASVGIPTTGAGIGVAVGAVGMVAGPTFLAIGETTAAGGYAFGTVLSGTTLAGGATLSATAATAVAAYEVAKMVTVPPSYTLGSGLVLGYGHLVQLSAQTLLAASDMAYLVLSLEGPRWVIYAVQGKLNNGADLIPGTVLDLERMKKKGEVFKYIPTGQDEIHRLLETTK
ncbi:MAG: hypothetical protein HYV97_04120 [Bdellovibrio sp.]|nr:hypothetical protein [Bdellovibrio sp.]